jgi:Flp pilus assembly protein TadD
MVERSMQGSPVASRTQRFRRNWLLVSILLAATGAAYGRLLWADFVTFDDGEYVTHNRHVPNGITWENVQWAFTTGKTGTWQPMVLLSHMLDVEFFGLWPGGHHLTNVLIHLANTLLLFVVLTRMTGDRGPSLFVAAVFALHPVHVESVAWISERKDVLSTFFWITTMIAYLRYLRFTRFRDYVLVSVSFALGLMAKPMLVTLPCVLLLLDYWPLRRVGTAARPFRWRTVSLLIAEKLPWMAMAAVSSVATMVTQWHTESVISVENLPMELRLSNALVSYMRYIGKAVWPADLAVFYPFPHGGIPVLHVFFAVGVLLCATIAALYFFRRTPYFTVGWFWYVGTLVPVVGFVQVGSQAMADRYTYIPLIGLSMIPAWGVPALLARWSRNDSGAIVQKQYRLVVMAACALCAIWALLTFQQAGTWKDSVHLFRHAAHVTEDNRLALANTGMALNGEGRYEEAIPYLERALQVRPDDAATLRDLAVANEKLGHYGNAIALYRRTLEFEPGDASALNNLGLCLLSVGQAAEALPVLKEALREKPDFEGALVNFGVALIQVGQVQEALVHLTTAARRFPANEKLRVNLGIAYAATGDTASAIREFEAALQLEPENDQARMNLQILRGLP